MFVGKSRLHASLENIRQVFRGMTDTNTLTYLGRELLTTVRKSFYEGVNFVINATNVNITDSIIS